MLSVGGARGADLSVVSGGNVRRRAVGPLRTSWWVNIDIRTLTSIIIECTICVKPAQAKPAAFNPTGRSQTVGMLSGYARVELDAQYEFAIRDLIGFENGCADDSPHRS